MHKGFSREVREAIKDAQVISFSTIRPSQQSAGTVVVGKDVYPKPYCGTYGGLTESPRQCSPTSSECRGQELLVGREERGPSAQLRQESEEREGRQGRLADRQLRGESLEVELGVEE